MTARDAGAGQGGLLAVHAHPDDETLATGALLATFAAAGLPATVVTCTRGEQGEVIPPDLAHLEGDGPGLAAHRTRELAGALAALGVDDHLWLDDLLPGDRRLVDSGMVWAEPGRATAGEGASADAFTAADPDELAGALADVVLDRRPAVVVGYEPSGGYGHPDHVQAHRVMTRAVELARRRDPAVAPVVLWAAVDESDLREGRAALAAAARVHGLPEVPGRTGPLAVADPAGPVASAVVPRADVDVVVEVGPVRGRVLGALRAHGTQVVVVHPEAELPGVALSNGVVEPLLARESYRVASGDVDAVVWPPGVRR